MSVVRTLFRKIPGVFEAARAIRRIPERVPHPVRRLAARRRLVALGPLRHVVVLSHGNICRSPHDEAVLRRLLSEVIAEPPVVESAGFSGPGRPSPPLARKTAADREFDLAGHRSRRVYGDMVADADLVVVMNGRQAARMRREIGVVRGRVLVAGDLDPCRITTREIRDPEGQAEVVFQGSHDRIDRCLGELVNVAEPAAGGAEGRSGRSD